MLALGRSLGREEAHRIVYECSTKAFETGAPLRTRLEERAEVTGRLGAEGLDRLFEYPSHVGLAPEIARQTVTAVLRPGGA